MTKYACFSLKILVPPVGLLRRGCLDRSWDTISRICPPLVLPSTNYRVTYLQSNSAKVTLIAKSYSQVRNIRVSGVTRSLRFTGTGLTAWADFLNSIISGVPKVVRADNGSENVTVENIQTSLTGKSHSFLYGRSVHNQVCVDKRCDSIPARSEGEGGITIFDSEWLKSGRSSDLCCDRFQSIPTPPRNQPSGHWVVSAELAVTTSSFDFHSTVRHRFQMYGFFLLE